MTSTLTRRLSILLLAGTLVACGDSTGPNANLTEEQIEDMMDAMSAISATSFAPGASFATVTVSETVDCPDGGSASFSGSVTDNTTPGSTSGSGTASITQNFNGCKATSSSGRLWTFDGDPNIVTSITSTFNTTTEVFSMSGTQKGGIKFSSDLGSGRCDIDITMSFSGDADSFEGSISGTVCGRNIQQSISLTP